MEIGSSGLRLATIEEFLRDPLGRYVAGRSYLIWVGSSSLAGSAYFGRPEEQEFAEILRLSRLPEHRALDLGFDALVDCSALEAVDPLAFATLTRHLAEIDAFTTKVGRVSLVRPTGIAGAITAGLFFETIQPQFRAALFSDVGEAFAWLGRPDVVAESARVGDAIARHRGTPEILRELRAHLASDAARCSVATAARTLGLSERSLSRRLGELGTSFRDEVGRARLRTAERLLVEGDLKLELVAERAGFHTRAHFSDYFRRATGETPSEFRARRR